VVFSLATFTLPVVSLANYGAIIRKQFLVSQSGKVPSAKSTAITTLTRTLPDWLPPSRMRV